ncbi:lipase/acyltransferase domain-containing protein [Paenibacillus sp. N3.4]|uniref:lipase/acyltransferase domain-containing protein n=1 Tax=Paenibacillus sp. N3.4 TaxID=2603222 RepID=UPI0011CC6DC5|nr:hypothetical protein [Paenibacillus sp. N3.4]TXK83550.1 hypothetical protein FU659_13325 [Paenibacillus sp. N3.4]
MRHMIIIPGIMGSVLKKEKTTIWPVLSLVHEVEYNFLYQLRYSKFNNELKPDATFKRYYRRIEQSLKLSFKNDLVTTFPYDWRKDNFDQIEDLKAEISTNADEVIIIAHSMGGLIAKMLVNEHKESEEVKKIVKIITLGTPWNGSPYAYRALKYGVGVPEKPFPLLISQKTSRMLAPTFDSIYQLLPSEEYHLRCITENKSPFLEFDGEIIKNWSDILGRYYLPLFIDKNKDFDEIYLRLRKSLDKEMDLEHHEVIGYGVETMSVIRENSINEPEGTFDNGDGTVPIISAISPQSIKYYINEGHQDLPRNKEVISLVKNIINGTEKVFVSQSNFKINYDEVKDISFNGKVLRIACPVIVSLVDENGDVIYGNIEILDESDLLHILKSQKYNVSSLGSTTYIILKENEEIPEKVIIEAYGAGSTSISVEEYHNGTITNLGSFDTFNISPDTSVELILSKNIKETKLIKYVKDKVINEDIVTSSKKSNQIVILRPDIQINIQSDDQFKEIENDVFVTLGKATLELTELIEGTYPVSGTYYSVNSTLDYRLITSNEPQLLDLNAGVNTIRIYSRDVFGNTSDMKSIEIYYLNDLLPHISFEFYEDTYKVNVQNVNEEFYKQYPAFEEKKTKVDFKDKTEVYDKEVFYKDLVRDLTIISENVLGEELKIDLKIDEKLVRRIFNGTISEEEFYSFLLGIGISRPIPKVIMTKYDGKGAYSKVTKEHILKSKRIHIEKNNIMLDIYKDTDLIISFQNLTQDILITEANEYLFAFKAINVKNKNEIRSMEFSALFTTKINDESFVSDDINVLFNEEKKYYEGRFQVQELRDFIANFWNPKGLQTVQLVVKEKGRNKAIETESITIR